MAGTLTISTLSDGTNSTSATNPIKGSAKAWVNFNGTNGSVVASYNVSSVTRNGTGDYTLNYTNALADSNYTLGFMIQPSSAQSSNTVHRTVNVKQTSPTQFNTVGVRVWTLGSGNEDYPVVTINIIGN